MDIVIVSGVMAIIIATILAAAWIREVAQEVDGMADDGDDDNVML